MRLITEIVMPKADSEGRTLKDNYVCPYVEFHQVYNKMQDVLGLYQHPKAGMEFNFRLEEDLNEG